MNYFEREDLIQLEALNMLCGKQIGIGAHRTVFENAFDSNLVVKIANSQNGIRANYAEYELWQEIQSTKYNCSIVYPAIIFPFIINFWRLYYSHALILPIVKKDCLFHWFLFSCFL